MEVDVSDYVAGDILSMKDIEGRQRSVAYLSKSLTETEYNYEIYDKKILAVIRELEACRYLLEDAKFELEARKIGFVFINV